MQKKVDFKREESIIEYWKNLDTDPLFEDYVTLVKSHPLLNSLSALTNSAFLILDHVTGRYGYAHESLYSFSGYPSKYYMEAGWEFVKGIVPLVHYEFGHSICHRLIFEYLYQQPVALRCQYYFSKDHMFYHANGTLFHLLQKGMVLKSDNKGNIQLTLHVLTNISHLKRENTCGLVLVGPNEETQIYSFDTASKILTDHGNITKREREILVLLEQKMDSKQIGGILNISSHTVDSHRRNLLNKLNCIDTTALVTYCKMCGLL